MLANRPTTAFIFNPMDAQGKTAAAARQTRYTTESYHRAVVRACDEAFPPPEHLTRQRIVATGRKRNRHETQTEWRMRLGEDQWAELKEWRKDHQWHPHRLRHNAATRIRKEYGIETARIILGHSTVGMTAIYAEVDQQKAIDAMMKIG